MKQVKYTRTIPTWRSIYDERYPEIWVLEDELINMKIEKQKYEINCERNGGQREAAEEREAINQRRKKEGKNQMAGRRFRGLREIRHYRRVQNNDIHKS